MGLFSRAKRELGVTDKKLLATGILARGNIVSAEPDGMTIGSDSNLQYGPEKVCRVVVEVIGLNGEEPYEATCKHSIPLIYIPKLQEPGAAVAVRVDPDDPQNIELDLGTEVPAAPIVFVSDDGSSETLKINKETASSADILRDGGPCTVEVLLVFPLNQLAPDGGPATGLVLQVHRDGVEDYQAQIGLHIPEAALPHVVVGATLPAKWVPGPGLPSDVNLVCPDWSAIAA